tara:strand:- start:1354 stop:2505 length:1152 start_codon:yes stop_codon:yes gene_type:complete
MSDLKLLISGWFKYPHSFSYVNLEQLLPLSDKSIDLYVDHRAPLFTNWLSCQSSESPLRDPRYKKLVSKLKPAIGGKFYDASFDIAVPPILSPFNSSRKSCFMVSEYGMLSKEYIKLCGGNDSFRSLADSIDVIFTPSEWSKQAILKQDIDPNKIKVLPHGVDRKSFLTNSEVGESSFANIRFPKGKIKVLHIGTPSFNKGTDLMIETIFKSPLAEHVCFIYKGNDSVYGSREKFTSYINAMEKKYRKKVCTLYIGENMSRQMLSQLIATADIYFSPFRAEGFNMPVAEAAACATTLVVSKCPPVTEFLTDSPNIFWILTDKKDSEHGRYHEPSSSSALSAFNKAIEFCIKKVSEPATDYSSFQLNIMSWDKISRLLLSNLIQ